MYRKVAKGSGPQHRGLREVRQLHVPEWPGVIPKRPGTDRSAPGHFLHEFVDITYKNSRLPCVLLTHEMPVRKCVLEKKWTGSAASAACVRGTFQCLKL